MGFLVPLLFEYIAYFFGRLLLAAAGPRAAQVRLDQSWNLSRKCYIESRLFFLLET